MITNVSTIVESSSVACNPGEQEFVTQCIETSCLKPKPD